MPSQLLKYTPEGYEIPQNSADYHKRADHFAAIYGDDHFFATGYAAPPAKPSTNFSVTGDVDFVLSQQIAWNAKPPQTQDSAIQAARESFARWRENHAEDFPTHVDILQNKVRGLQRLSGGGFMFVESAFADAPETRVALFRRTFGQKVLTDANGLVSSPDTAEKEMVEEYTPILESADGKLTVLAVKIGAAHTPFTDAQLLAVKRAQEAKIRENLGGYVGALHYGVATLQELPMKKNTLSLKDGEGNIIETMSGSIGFEHDNNTWVYRKAGLLRVPNEFSIKLVDGEFERKGDFYTPEQLEKIIQSNDALSSTCAFGNEFLKQWPRASRTAALPDPRPDIR